MRVYPTIWTVGRRCTEEDELGGYRIPVGMTMSSRPRKEIVTANGREWTQIKAGSGARAVFPR